MLFYLFSICLPRGMYVRAQDTGTNHEVVGTMGSVQLCVGQRNFFESTKKWYIRIPLVTYMSKFFGPSKKDIEKMIDKKINTMEAMIDKKVNAEHESNKKARRTVKAQLSKLIEKNESDIDQLQPAVVELKKKVKENSSRIQENANDIMTNAGNVATNSATMIKIIGQLKM